MPDDIVWPFPSGDVSGTPADPPVPVPEATPPVEPEPVKPDAGIDWEAHRRFLKGL